ncbi:DUF3987 domain-containing protein [Methylobacterium soli]|uniref:DUF3987 domain-containing protein n=1 Tax=Methylobacterium soli TaxID=553447 RepID=UPI00177D052C|nr:DUF3987 domain-containing protein [Methylobacterium soli]
MQSRIRVPRSASPWPDADLTLLGTGRRPAPEFPLPLLGSWAEWVTTKAHGASAPVDYVAVALLGSVGAALANVRWPVAGAGWSEPPLLWCAEVGPPSSSKSPSMDAAFDLVRFAEDRMGLGFEAEQKKFATSRQTSEAHLEAWKAAVKTAVKNGCPPPVMPSEAQPPDAPVRPRIRVADATVEALGALAAALPRGLLLVRDELAGWLGALDKYGGSGSDRAFAIEMYGGRSYVVDRVKNPEPLQIRHLSVGVLGGVPLVPLVPIAAAQRRGSAPIGANDAIGTGVPVDHRTFSPRRPAGDPAAAEPLITAADWLAHYEERAAICELDGGLPRPEAEQLAQADTIAALGPQPSPADRRMP